MESVRLTITQGLTGLIIPLSLGAIILAVALIVKSLRSHSSWRIVAEGLATIGLAVLAVLSGFSIGYMFVPLLVVMMWVCIQHLRTHTR